ncbi:MAG: orotate phosphoribosyltransferase [Acidobacteriota bacterium]
MEKLRNRLLELLRRKSVQIGSFTLTSGQTSHYYLDSKHTTLHPEGACLSARLILEELKRRNIRAEAIGGLTLGADPIVSAVAAVSFLQRELYPPLHGFIVRKEPKKHGTQRFIEGFEGGKGSPVVIVDDVCTTGNSALLAAQRAEAAGYRVVAVVCLVDREQGGSERLRSYPFFSLLKASEILDDATIQRRIAEQN